MATRHVTFAERAEDSGTPADVLEAGELCRTALENAADLFDRYDADWNDVTAAELEPFWRAANDFYTRAHKLLGTPRVRGMGGALVVDWAALAKRRGE